MTYTVDLKKILKLINPLEQDILEIGHPININEIMDYVENVNFVINNEDNKKQQLYKKIAFIVSNYEDTPIHLNVGFPEKGNEIIDIVTKNKLTFIAAVLKDKKNIDIEVTGSPKLIKLLFGINVDTTTTSNELKIENNIEIINLYYEDSSDKIINKWSNIDFCIKQIEIASHINRAKVIQIISLIDSTVFNDASFINHLYLKSLNLNMLHLLPQTLLISPLMRENILKENEVFRDVWLAAYTNLLELENYEYEEENNLENPQLIEKIKEFREFLEKNYFSNKKWVLDILSVMQYENATDFYEKLNNKNKIDCDIVSYLLMKKNNGDYQDITIPDEFFEKIDNCALYINKIKKMYSYKKIIIDKVTVDKKSIMEMIEKIISPERIVIFFKQNWSDKNLKIDPDIIELGMKKSIQLYEYYSVNHKQVSFFEQKYQTKEIVERYLENEGDLCYVPFNLLDKLNENVIINAINNNRGFLIGRKSPKEWRTNKKYVVLLKENIYQLGLSSNAWSKMLGKKIEEYQELISLCPDVYHQFQKNIMLNPDVVISYIKSFDSHSNTKKAEAIVDIKKSFFGSIDFCIETLKVNEYYIKKIPEFFFTEKTFLRKLTKAIDKNEIKKNVIYLNKELQKFFERMEDEEGYERFLSNYILKLELKKAHTVIKKIKI